MPRRLVDNDPRREQERQSLLLDRLEAQVRGRIAAEIARAMRDSLDVFEMTGQVQPARDHRENMEAIYRQMYQESFRVFGMRIVDQGKSLGHVLERKESFFDMFVRAALEFVQQELIRARITQVTDTTRQQIVNQIERGFDEGLSVAETAKLIRDNVQGISIFRANVISRTELHGAANAGADRAARETRLQIRKEWVASKDLRTRAIFRDDAYDHWSMNGQVVGMDEMFLMPYAFGDPVPCMWPGDPALPAGGVINCRCATSHIVVE